MAWLTITARFIVPGIVLLTILVNLSHQSKWPIHVKLSNQKYSGNCASIGYSTKCCPPGESCEASDGNCKCNASCHSQYLNNCCEDVFCHPSNNNVYHIIIIITLNILQIQERAKMLDVAIVTQGVILIIISMMKMEMKYHAMVFLTVVSSSLLDHAWFSIKNCTSTLQLKPVPRQNLMLVSASGS